VSSPYHRPHGLFYSSHYFTELHSFLYRPYYYSVPLNSTITYPYIDHALEVYRVDTFVLGNLLSSLVLTNTRFLFYSNTEFKS